MLFLFYCECSSYHMGALINWSYQCRLAGWEIDISFSLSGHINMDIYIFFYFTKILAAQLSQNPTILFFHAWRFYWPLKVCCGSADCESDQMCNEKMRLWSYRRPWAFHDSFYDLKTVFMYIHLSLPNMGLNFDGFREYF